MAKTLESRLYNIIKKKPDSSAVKQLIEKGVDCNSCRFDPIALTFISLIQLAAENDRHRTLSILYKHRNSPTKTQLEKHLAFYITHHVQSQQEENEILFDYTVSRLLYARITDHSKKVLHTLIVALHDYDDATIRGTSLVDGSSQIIFLQLRIYSLLRRAIEMTLNSEHDMLTIVADELLHNLETYYFLISIQHIPVIITDKLISEKFSKVKSSQTLLMKYYRSIAENVKHKIEQLKVDQEYTIPTGWKGHAVCVSFRRINDTHIHIRVDNPSPNNPSEMHVIVHIGASYDKVKPKILGQLKRTDLDVNMDYFISLIDSVNRDLEQEEGISLIYDLSKQIRNLDRRQTEDMPGFTVQANANCFVKCFEPGFVMRLDSRYPRLYQNLLLCEQNNANELVRRRKNLISMQYGVEEHQRWFKNIYFRFISLDQEENIHRLPVLERTRLQDRLKTSYQQHYQYLSSNSNTESCSPLTEKYIPLHFENEKTPIELKNLFIKPRILLLGDAGCGKTTICQYATYLWAQGRIWRSRYEWLFYIKMRNLNSLFYPPQSNIYSLIDIIERECFQGYGLLDLDKQKLTIQFKSPSNILWILDGYDERSVPDYLRPIEHELLFKPHLLVTSRPYETFGLQYDARVHIQNFEEQDIKNYVKKYFPAMFRTSASKCWLFIRSSESLKQIARVPACLEVICNLWNSEEDIFEWGTTIEELYEKMCVSLLRRYLLKFHRQCTSSLVGRDIYQQPNALAFTHLENVAFEATKLHRFIVTGHELANVTGTHFYSALQIGLLVPKRRNPSSVLVENNYYFVHRSFQEYLCVRYMIRVLSSTDCQEELRKVIQFIINEKYNRLLQNTFRMFFELNRSNVCTDQFWSAVDREPRDLIGLRHCCRIIRWFPRGSCIFSYEDEQKINKRTVDVVKIWISNKNRLAHDDANRYLFDWFVDVIDHQDWLDAWKEDLYMTDSSKRRYFLPELWSTQTINVLQEHYDKVPRNIEELHRLITRGPNINSCELLHLDANLFNICTTNDQTEIPSCMTEIQRKVSKHEPINSPTELQELLQIYVSFAKYNRRLMEFTKEPWTLAIAPSALDNINNGTLDRLIKTIQQDALFFRFIKLSVVPFLELYSKQNSLNDDTLRSLIVSITLSSECLLTVPPGENKLIRVCEDEHSAEIQLDPQNWDSLIRAFSSARDDYGYSYFEQDN